MQLTHPCTIWYVGAHREGRDGKYFHSKFNCLMHVFEPIADFFNTLKTQHWTHHQNVFLHNYGLGAKDEKISGISLKGDGTFLRKSTQSPDHTTKTAFIRSFNQTWSELNTTNLDLLHINCEGCEFHILNGIFKQNNVISHIKTIQIQAHYNELYRNNIFAAYCGLIQNLLKSHHIIFQRPFLWERWDINQLN